MSLARTEPFQSPSTPFTRSGYFSGDNSHEGRQHPQTSRIRGSRIHGWAHACWFGSCRRPVGDHRPGHLGRSDHGDRHGDGESGRPGDDLVRRIRNEHELRHEDRERQRRVGHGEHGSVGLAHGSHGRHDLPLPGGGDEQLRHGSRRRRNLHHVGRAGRGYRFGDERDDDDRDTQRHRRSERTRDGLVLRVRDEHELRLEDGREERRLGYEHGGRLGVGVGPDAWPALPLSPRCDQRRRNEPRRGPDLLDDHGAHDGYRGRELDRPDVGEAQRPSHTEWASHDLVLRVRHGHELRHQDADEEPRRGHERRQRRRIAHGPEKDHHLPLSPGRDERLRHDFWRRPDLQHVACACGQHRCRPERWSDDGDADGRGRPEEAGRRTGTSSTGRRRGTGRGRRRGASPPAPGREASAHRSRVSRQGRPTITGSSRRAMQGPVEGPTRRSRRSASRSPLPRAWSSTDAASRCRDPFPSSAPARP